MVGPGRAELAAAMGASSVVASLILGQDRPQMLLAEDQHPVGDLSPGGEHESFRIGIRARAPKRDLHSLDAGAGQDCVECLGELPCPVTDQEPEIPGAIAEIHQEIAICWAVYGPSGFAVTPGICTYREPTSITNRQYRR
jgi:hypothetical protein